MKRILFFCTTLLISLSPTIIQAAFTFPNWLLQQTQEYRDSLHKTNASLSPDEIKHSQQRIKEAYKLKDWIVVANELTRLAGKYSENRQYWLELSLALQQKNKMNAHWRTEEEARYAAIQVYHLSQTDEDRAIALLIYGNTLNPESGYEAPSFREIYQAATALADVRQLKKRYPELANLMAFNFLRIRINNQTSPPSACFLFSHPLSTKEVNYRDFFDLSAKADVDVKPHDQELCVAPLEFGATYRVAFKAGFPSAFGEKFEKMQEVAFKVRDQAPRLSFSPKAYLIKREENTLIPLSAVNIETISLRVLRVPDRALNQVVNNSSYFNKPLWEFNLQEIQDLQGELVWQGEMDFNTERNKTITKYFPFSDVIKSIQPGAYIIQAEEKGVVFEERAKATQWLIVSDIGLTVFSSATGEITVSARSLKTAKPMANVEVHLLAYNNTILKKVNTSKEGIASFEASLTQGKGGNRPALILAYGSLGNFSLLNLHEPAFDLSDRGVAGRKVTGPLDAFLYTEQGVYRPGATVHVNTLLRNDKGMAAPDLPMTFKILRPDAIEVERHTLVGDSFGFYECPLKLSTSARLGQWTVLAFIDPKKQPIAQTHFMVEDFVPARLITYLKPNKSSLMLNNPVSVAVEANYLFGAKAAGLEGSASLNLRVNSHPYPQYSGFSFGLLDELWVENQIPLTLMPLDKQGRGTLLIHVDKAPETSKPLEAVIQVNVADKGERPETAEVKLPFFHVDHMIGIKPLFQGDTLEEEEASFEIITVNAQGELKKIEQLEYEVFLEDISFSWFQSAQNMPWQYRTVKQDKFLQKGVFNTDTKRMTNLKILLKETGQYRLEVKDPNTKVATSVRFYKGWKAVASALETPDYLTVRAEKEVYKPGESLLLYIKAPFEGQGLLTIANQNILETKNILISSKETQIKLSPNEKWGSGVYCMVSAFRPLDKEDKQAKPFLPKRAVGVAWVGIDPDIRKLNVSLELPKEILPRQTIELPIQVKGEIGKLKLSSRPKVTIAAVDEGILNLTKFSTPKPEDYFFGKRQLNIEFRDVYGRLIQAVPGTVGKIRSGGDKSLLSYHAQALTPSLQTFKIVSLYHQPIELDKEGKGKVKLDIPDFNGSLRVMAVAFDDKQVGHYENTLLVRDPIVLEGSLPRFLSPTDESRLLLSLHNVAGEAGLYKILIKGEGTIAVNNTLLTVKLEKDQVYKQSIPIQANRVGEGKVTIQLQGPGIQISRDFNISIRPSAPYISRTESRLLKPLETMKIQEALEANNNLETERILTTWSSNVPWNTEILFHELTHYNYAGVEQNVSKALGALALNKPETAQLIQQVLSYLTEAQQPHGAFPRWERDKEDPWLTAYVVDFLQKAKEKNHAIPEFTLERSLLWLSSYLQQMDKQPTTEFLQTASYALYVLAKTDKIENGALRYFYDSYYEDLPDPLSRAFLGAALAIRGDLLRANQAYLNLFELKATKDVPSKSYDLAPFGSLIRDKAAVMVLANEVSLKASALQNVTSLIRELSQALTIELSPRMPSFLTLQEQAWLLWASQIFYNQSEESINLRINGQSRSSSQAFLAETFSSEVLKSEITIQNTGKQPLWQHLTLSGIPRTPRKAVENGFKITKNYYTLEGKLVTDLKLAQGTQLIALLEGKAETGIKPHQLLVIDFLPAGFEIEDVSLNTKGSTSLMPWLNEISKVQYVESRDDRFIGAVLLDEKTRNFKLAYIVRAVTPGTYVHPGLFVEDLYSPQYHARTEEKHIQIYMP